MAHSSSNLMPTSWANNIAGTYCSSCGNFLDTGTGWWKTPSTLHAVALPYSNQDMPRGKSSTACSAGLRDRNSALDLTQFVTVIFFRWRKFLTTAVWSNSIFRPLTKIDCESEQLYYCYFSQRAFSTNPTARKSFPEYFHLTPAFSIFKSDLKTYLFSFAYVS